MKGGGGLKNANKAEVRLSRAIFRGKHTTERAYISQL